jgi:flagella basal body P-ring formation protein FlgA
MTSSAELLAALLTPLLAVLAPLAPPRVVAPAVVEARVVARVAETWSVPERDVTLAWGRLPAGLAAAEQAPLELVGRGSDGWFAVVLRPAGAPPLALRVRAGVKREVAVATRPLPLGTLVADDDVRLAERLVWGPPRVEARAGAGWTVRRPLAAGESLAWPAAAPPALIDAGSPVTLVWMRGSVRVSRPGIALNAARAGELVHVRPLEGGGHRRGIATAPGEVTLDEGGRP